MNAQNRVPHVVRDTILRHFSRAWSKSVKANRLRLVTREGDDTSPFA
jgi:hypothetical protein